MIDTREALLEWRNRAIQTAPGRVSLDLEADSLHRYQEKLCLIQYADEAGCLLIDPLYIEDMSPFSSWLTEAEIWMHGADYDMQLFRKAFATLPRTIYDTQIAARLCGMRHFGLAHLLEHYFGLVVSKASQRADWAKRPLSPAMTEYAYTDVRHMLPLADLLTAKLASLGRTDWFLESCQNALTKGWERSDTPNPDAWRISGSGRLNPKALAALKILWDWRDQEARNWDKPSFMVAGNKDLLLIATELANGDSPTIPGRVTKGRLTRFRDAVARFHAMPASRYPERQRRPSYTPRDDDFDRKVAKIQEKRDRVALSLDLDPTLLATRQQMELIAENSANISQLMHWQQSLLKL